MRIARVTKVKLNTRKAGMTVAADLKKLNDLLIIPVVRVLPERPINLLVIA